MSIKDKVEITFGEKALEHALFFKYETGLRFELSKGKSNIEKFISAYNKAEKILKYAFQGSEIITVCLAYYGEDTILGNLSSLKGLEEFDIKIKDFESWEECDSEEGDKRIFIGFEIQKEELIKILWGVLATELGIAPQIGCDPYFIDFNNEILAHPYDDRGMDIIGKNKELLQELYNKFHKYLLECNIPRMKKYYN